VFSSVGGGTEPEAQVDAGVAEVQARTPSRRHRRLVVGALIVGVAAVAAVVAASRGGLPSAPAVTGGGSAPAFELDNVRPDDAPVSLAAARGKPVVLNFWASWCVPCRREMPAFQAVHQATKDRVTFLGVNNQDQRGPALRLLAETGVRYSSGFDPTGEVALAYGLYGMPTTVFISADGQLLERKTGEISRAQLEASIDRLFGGT
jgi:cytochrome c biogenesis protein CcmG, thiol:disulfide interchange protein DsbE